MIKFNDLISYKIQEYTTEFNYLTILIDNKEFYLYVVKNINYYLYYNKELKTLNKSKVKIENKNHIAIITTLNNKITLI